MKKMEVVIIEDEDLAAESLEGLLLSSGKEVTIKERLESVRQAIAWFDNNSCDLIFSDIHLGDGESFEIFERLQLDIPIIFTTAYDHYAIQAFQFYAIDYLLKPYDQTKLIAAIDKYSNYSGRVNSSYNQLEALINRMQHIPESPAIQTRFLVSRGKELLSVTSSEIAYFMAENKSLFLFTTAGDSFLYDGTLSHLEQRLSKEDFFKINRKFIVSHQAITSITRHSQNRLKIELNPSPGTKELILVSSKTVQAFKDWLNH